MISIGRFNTLTVTSASYRGYTLDGGNQEIFLPAYEVKKPLHVGEKVTVFIYNDQKSSLKATMREPVAQVGEFAVMTVKDVQPFGAFLDWGIPKDLFLPSKHQKREYTAGEFALVRLILDYEKSGVIGTSFIEEYISYDTQQLHTGQKVDMLVIGESKLGYNLIVNDAYRGMLFRSDALIEIERGMRITGYIRQIREDGKLDCVLKPIGFTPAVQENQRIILDALEEHGGVLYLHDRSPAELIRDQLHMSKKQFKAAIGTLYKAKRIRIEEDRILLNR